MQKLRQNYGRTMLEMLSVLTIVGILLAVGLSMYKSAIYSHKANIILNDARMIAATVLQKETITIDDENVINTNEYTPETTYVMRARRQIIEDDEAGNNFFAVEVYDVEKGVCRAVLDKVGNNYEQVRVNRVDFDGFNTDICNGPDGLNFIEFVFNESDPICLKPCGEDCCGRGFVCDAITKSCVAAAECDDASRPCGDECCLNANSCCGEKNCCDGATFCCNGECGCPKDENGLALICNYNKNNGAGACVCPGGMELTDGICQCPVGFALVNGKCKGVTCYNPGTKVKCNQDRCWCYIGDQRCGAGCDQNGLLCTDGSCVNECPTGKNGELPAEYTYYAKQNLFGCKSRHYFGPNKTDPHDIFCTRYAGSLSNCADMETNKLCGHNFCSMNAMSGCAYGACDVSQCSEGDSVKEVIKPKEIAGTLHVIQADYACWDGAHYCSGYCTDENVFICATGCSDNDFDKCNTDYCGKCPDGMTYNTENKGCCGTDGVCCYIGVGNGYYCEKDGVYCGDHCGATGETCHGGACKESECNPVKWLPGGYCYDTDTKVLCRISGGSYTCSREVTLNADGTTSGGTFCGTGCKVNGEGCPACLDSNVNLCPDGGTQNGQSCVTGRLSCQINSGYFSCTVSGAGWCGYCSKSNGRDCYENASLKGTRAYCSVADCPSGTQLLYNTKTRTYECGVLTGLDCQEAGDRYTCSFGTNQCGTNCSSDGKNCETGTCDTSSDGCPAGTYLEQTTSEYYGCYNATTATSCYRFGEDADSNPLYVCYKDGKECGDGCNADGTKGIKEASADELEPCCPEE